MKVREIHSGDKSFKDRSGLPFFHSDAWASFYSKGYRRYTVSRTDGAEILAIFSIYCYKKLGKNIVITPPLCPYSGLVFVKSDGKLFKKQSDTKRVLRAIGQYLDDSFSGHYISLALSPEIRDIQPFQQLDFKTEVGYTFLLNLREQSEESLLKGMSTERRKNIRDGLKSDLVIRVNPDQAKINALITHTLLEQGVEPHSDLLRSLLNENSPKIFTLGAFHNENLLATIVVAVDKKRAFYLAGGTMKGSSEAGPLVLWNAILKAREMEVEIFDFMGSSVPAIERYFRGFGGELTPYFRIGKNTTLIDALRSAKQRLK